MMDIRLGRLPSWSDVSALDGLAGVGVIVAIVALLWVFVRPRLEKRERGGPWR